MVPAFVLDWLRALYFRGPSFNGWGFWEGTSPEDACAAATGLPARHFDDSTSHGPIVCAELLDRKFDAFAICVLYAIGSMVIWRLFSDCIAYQMTVRPLISALRDAAVEARGHERLALPATMTDGPRHRKRPAG